MRAFRIIGRGPRCGLASQVHPLNPFVYQLGELFCEAAPAEEIVRRFGTPVIAYSAAGLRANIAAVREAFTAIDPEIRFPVQSIPSPGVLRVIAARGVIPGVGGLRLGLRGSAIEEQNQEQHHQTDW